jgi:ribosomal protein S18 acetylase RimI-like enzyme
MKVIQIKNEQGCASSMDFLRKNSSVNLYLYEGIAGYKRYYRNFCFKSHGRILGIVHTKNGEYFHLFLLEDTGEDLAVQIKAFIFQQFPNTSVFFGESGGLENFLRNAHIVVIKRRDYLYMEVARDRFIPSILYSCVQPPPEMASKLLPLQIQYEMEELGVQRSEIHSLRVKAALKKRLERKEITAMFQGSEPVAMAAVNARFEHTCQIGSVFVVPACRGRGLGRSIISAHVERLFNKYEKIALFVDIHNRSAINIYKKIGFRTAGELMQVHIRAPN